MVRQNIRSFVPSIAVLQGCNYVKTKSKTTVIALVSAAQLSEAFVRGVTTYSALKLI